MYSMMGLINTVICLKVAKSLGLKSSHKKKICKLISGDRYELIVVIISKCRPILNHTVCSPQINRALYVNFKLIK